MKRIFSKKSGFTLVEIIVAFAIFAIMATMILSMVQLTVRQRKTNTQFADTIQQDSEYLLSHYVGDSDKFADADGEFVLDFGSANIEAKMEYQMRAAGHTQEAEGVNYFVGDTSVRKPNNLESELPSDAAATPGNGQDGRYDTWLKGSRGLGSITIWDVQKVPENSYNGPGYCYMIKCSAAADDVDEDYKNYMTYSLSFSMPKDDNPSEVTRVDENGDKYLYKYPRKAEILAYGYVNSNVLTWDSNTCVANNNHIPRNNYTFNKFLVEQTCPNTLHIGSTLGTKAADFSNTNYTTLWVAFAEDPELTASSFGSNGTPVGANGMRYGNYTKHDEYGNEDGTELNVYGAHELEKTAL